MNYPKIETAARWEKFANLFAKYIIDTFSNGQEFCSSDVRDTLVMYSEGEKLNENYQKLCCRNQEQRLAWRSCKWDLWDFERVYHWLETLENNGVLVGRDRKIGESGFRNCPRVYRVADQYVNKDKKFYAEVCLMDEFTPAPFIKGPHGVGKTDIAKEQYNIMMDRKIEKIISDLKLLDVDGETLEYIIRQVGMEDQMMRQLSNDKSLQIYVEDNEQVTVSDLMREIKKVNEKLDKVFK